MKLLSISSLFLLLSCNGSVHGFASNAAFIGSSPSTLKTTSSNNYHTTSSSALQAGGFEWDDPEDTFDQGVDNPYKKGHINQNPDGSMVVDPARLLAPRLQGTNLYFIGMMGSGKSAVGDNVARRMGTYNFLDTDQIIESATGMSIPEIFEQEGEEEFRKVEAQILDSVHAHVRCVISTGGGLVCRIMNWSKLQSGIVVWLNVAPDVIMSRIEGTDRPLLQTENPQATLEKLLEERLDKYQQADVHIEVDQGMNVEDTANAVIKALHEFIDENPPSWKNAQPPTTMSGEEQ